MRKKKPFSNRALVFAHPMSNALLQVQCKSGFTQGHVSESPVRVNLRLLLEHCVEQETGLLIPIARAVFDALRTKGSNILRTHTQAGNLGVKKSLLSDLWRAGSASMRLMESIYVFWASPSGKMILLTKKKITIEIPP